MTFGGAEDRADAEDPLDAAEPRLERIGQEEHARDLAEAQGHDRQVVAAQPQDRGADEQAGDGGADDHDRQRDPERELPAERRGRRREEGGEVGADRVEGHVAEVEQAGVADHDVEPEAQQDVEADQHQHLAQQRPGELRQGEQQDDQHEDDDPSHDRLRPGSACRRRSWTRAPRGPPEERSGTDARGT